MIHTSEPDPPMARCASNILIDLMPVPRVSVGKMGEMDMSYQAHSLNFLTDITACNLCLRFNRPGKADFVLKVWHDISGKSLHGFHHFFVFQASNSKHAV